MNRVELIEYLEEFYADCVGISRRKNLDYTGDESDPFGNFTAVESLGINTEIGILSRMMDKMKRIASIVQSGEVAVKEESVEDTLKDLANYSAIFSAYLKSKKHPVLKFQKQCCGDWNSDGECNCKLSE